MLITKLIYLFRKIEPSRIHRVDMRKPLQKGFALVAILLVMSLMVVLVVAMLSLSTKQIKRSEQWNHKVQAQSNARMALMLAMNELQKHAGPDQRVTARAAILENQKTVVANRNWVGVWRTSVERNGENWPVIGKGDPERSPYSRANAYEDLRHTQSHLASDQWRLKLRQAWLVSQRDNNLDADQQLEESDPHVIEILGRGTLGNSLSVSDFNRERVLVQKIEIGKTGAYAWYVEDNNQKASIDPGRIIENVEAALETSPRGNPKFVKLADGQRAYKDFTTEALTHRDKVMTYRNLSLTQSNPRAMNDALKEKHHHFTTYAPGLFTDTMKGGLRKDLTPLLLAYKKEKTINLSEGSGGDGREFSSSYPIISGPDHGVLGPSFGALRNWALHAYTTGNTAELTAPEAAVRMRPGTYWPHGISDGASLDAGAWAESAPKIHPVMTDARWHYYFSHHNQRVRTHVIPRVCLWNPYNKRLEVPDLTVMMPNPFYNITAGIHFFPEADHVDELKMKFKDQDGGNHPFTKWIAKGGYVGGDVFKVRLNPFPETRYLAFTLDGTTMEAGECHVFSPKITKPGVQSNGVSIQPYQTTNIAENVLSSSSPQGVDHFYYDHDASVDYQIQAPDWTDLTTAELSEIHWARIFDYQPEVVMQSAGKVESFPFILKPGKSSSLSQLYNSSEYPTLQLINNASGGANANTYFAYLGLSWGGAGQAPGNFGNLQKFSEAPLKDAPATHQVGAKLLWLDESFTEGGAAPLRADRWTSDHMAYNVSLIANWNVRAQLTTRSPVSQCADKWYLSSTGPWLLQFSPLSPQDFNDQPSLNKGGSAFVKNPFGSASSFPFQTRVVLFDLPSSDYGVISMAKLRHAMLSPYSWNPSYIIGHSLRDMHAPAESTLHDDDETGYRSRGNGWTRWDYLLGGSRGALGHGAYTERSNSEGLLQIGSEAVNRDVGTKTVSSSTEVLAYDIAYEVNQNLWDGYFISGMPLNVNTESFDWNPNVGKHLWNRRYQFNFHAKGRSLDQALAELSSGDAKSIAFWKNAEILKNKAAFNVNSTSVDAWVAFLSGSLGVKRPLESGSLDGTQVSFERYRNPVTAAGTNSASPDVDGGWGGSRQLTEEELVLLGKNIVREVKERGPFLSIADFVNRRLTEDQDDRSRMGALAAAIQATGLNIGFEDNSRYQTTAINVGKNTDAPDNNLVRLKESYRYQKDGAYTTVQPTSKAWGMPGFLIQSDVLEPIAAAISVRGDAFTIRAYGESSDGGSVKARSWIEATVERIPEYVDSSSSGNAASDDPILIEHSSGVYSKGNLTELNQKWGRKFIITSVRWLNPNEI